MRKMEKGTIEFDAPFYCSLLPTPYTLLPTTYAPGTFVGAT